MSSNLTGREGVTVTAAWLSKGPIRSGDAAILLRADGEVRVDGLGIEFHAPENSGALFLPSLTKEDVAPGDRLVSVFGLGVASTTDIKFRASQLAIDYKDWETVLTTLRSEGFSKTECIRATVEVRGLTLPDAKRLVHQSDAWSDVRGSDDQLIDEVVEEIGEFGSQNPEP